MLSLWFRFFTLAPVAGLICSLWAGLASAADLPVKEGQQAPDVELKATQIGAILPDQKDAKSIRLKDLQGKKNVVLWFFPKAMTGGWTAEACAFRDRLEQFAQLDTVIIGISTDKIDDQQKFTGKEKLTFPLVGDPNAAVCKAFGAVSGKKKTAARMSVVIDKNGTIKKIYPNVAKAGDHPEEVLKFVKENLKKE